MESMDMKLVKDKEFGGERPLFATHNLRLENVTIHAGESALKCCRNIEAVGCTFPSGMWTVSGLRTAFSLPERVPLSGIREDLK